MQSLPVIQLNDRLAQNWKVDAQPVAILNPQSSIHERIAFCWGLAENLSVIADLGIASNDAAVRSFASLIASSLQPLRATVDNLASETYEADQGAACSGTQ